MRVERLRVEVLARRREHAQALLAEPRVLVEVALPERVVDSPRPSGPGRGAYELRASSWSGAPLTNARTTSRPDSSCIRWNVAISLYAESNGSSATRG